MLKSRRRQSLCHDLTRSAGVAAMVALASAAPSEIAFGDAFPIALASSGDQIEVPEWVQLFPKGPAIVARDGRRWTLSDPTILVDAFKANAADLPVDIEHAAELKAPKGEEAPAQGWIKKIEIREGLAFAQVDWNEEGRRKVASKQYRYVSPAFRFTKTGEIIGLSSLALVTRPALNMPALAHEQGGATPEDSSMALAALLCAHLGLPAGSGDAAIVTAVTTQTALASDARNPEKLVPAADLQAALTRATTAETALAAIQTADKTKAVETAVDQAIADQKIAPASREHWIGLASADLDGFGKAMAAMTPGLQPTDTGKKPAGETNELGLTAQQIEIATAQGLTPAAYAAALKD